MFLSFNSVFPLKKKEREEFAAHFTERRVKRYGLILQVVASTRSEEKSAMLLNNGAGHVVMDNGRLQEQIRAIYPRGVDKVLELVGKLTLKDSLECAAPGGCVCMTGMLAEKWSVRDFDPMAFIPSSVKLTVYGSGALRVDAAVFQQFITEVEEGRIKLPVSRIFKLEDIADAHRLMESNTAGGKIVVLI